MNVRLGDGSLRWRVTRTEVDLLLGGRAVSLKINLPHARSFQTSIRASTITGWQLESDPTGLWLTIPRDELETLVQCLPTKAPIEHKLELDGGELKLSFDVDVMPEKRR